LYFEFVQIIEKPLLPLNPINVISESMRAKKYVFSLAGISIPL